MPVTIPVITDSAQIIGAAVSTAELPIDKAAAKSCPAAWKKALAAETPISEQNPPVLQKRPVRSTVQTAVTESAPPESDMKKPTAFPKHKKVIRHLISITANAPITPVQSKAPITAIFASPSFTPGTGITE